MIPMDERGPVDRGGSRRRGPSKGDLREQAILDTARRLLADKPAERITIDDLVSGAGISRPTFYFYFASKQAVFEALLDPVAGAFIAVADGFLDNPPDRGELRASLGKLAAVWQEHGPIMRVMMDDSAVGALRDCRDRMIGRLVANATTRIERDRASGLAPAGPPADVTAAVLTRLLVTTLTDAAAPAESPDGAAAPGRVSDELLDALTTVIGRSIYAQTPTEKSPPERGPNRAGHGPQRRPAGG